MIIEHFVNLCVLSRTHRHSPSFSCMIIIIIIIKQETLWKRIHYNIEMSKYRKSRDHPTSSWVNLVSPTGITLGYYNIIYRRNFPGFWHQVAITESARMLRDNNFTMDTPPELSIYEYGFSSKHRQPRAQLRSWSRVAVRLCGFQQRLCGFQQRSFIATNIDDYYPKLSQWTQLNELDQS